MIRPLLVTTEHHPDHPGYHRWHAEWVDADGVPHALTGQQPYTTPRRAERMAWRQLAAAHTCDTEIT